VELIEAALGKPAQREILPEQPGDVPNTWANIDKARRDLGYSPQIPPAVGIPLFVEWYRTIGHCIDS
jgi:UDP-glucuronate 4-epimerase